MNNCWYQVRIYPGESTKWVNFKHPVLPGAHVGGWMMSEHYSTAMKLPLVTAPSESQQEFTLAEVKKHNKKEDLWIVIDRCVIDVTSYVNDHPGILIFKRHVSF
jgi:cytochrome b involved in lipid metabolism